MYNYIILIDIYVHIVELIRLAPQYIKLRLVLYDTACVGSGFQ